VLGSTVATDRPDPSVLDVRGLRMRYGSVDVLDRVD
jgi:hypothetical protein